jgi:hypothetical protein
MCGGMGKADPHYPIGIQPTPVSMPGLATQPGNNPFSQLGQSPQQGFPGVAQLQQWGQQFQAPQFNPAQWQQMLQGLHAQQPPQQPFNLQQWTQNLQGAPGTGTSQPPMDLMQTPMIQQAMNSAPQPTPGQGTMPNLGMAAGGAVPRGKVTLSPEERKLARMLGMTDIEFARNKLRMLQQREA